MTSPTSGTSIRNYGTIQISRTDPNRSISVGCESFLDIPFNHSSNEHPWFKEAVEDPTSRSASSTISAIRPTAPQGPWHMARAAPGKGCGILVSSIFTMPDLGISTDSKSLKEVKAIAKFWLDRELDGFRRTQPSTSLGIRLATFLSRRFCTTTTGAEFSDAVYLDSATSVQC